MSKPVRAGLLRWLAVLLLTQFAAVTVFAQSAVWQARLGDAQFYLGGTVHVLSASDYPLPAAFDIAYARADTVVFETDMAAMATPAAQRQMAAISRLPDGASLEQVLSKDTYRVLSAYLHDAGLDVAMFNHVRPAMLAMTLTLIELQRLGVGERGVDSVFAARAQQDGKGMIPLETLDEHLAYLRDIAQGAEDAFLRYTLADMDDLQGQVDDLMAFWRAGDLAALNAQVLAPMRDEFPEVYAALIVERNQAWLEQLEAMAATPDIELVLVGVAHLAGSDGLIAALRRNGFILEPLVAEGHMAVAVDAGPVLSGRITATPAFADIGGMPPSDGGL